jgi:hypothetical protein
MLGSCCDLDVGLPDGLEAVLILERDPSRDLRLIHNGQTVGDTRKSVKDDRVAQDLYDEFNPRTYRR